MRKSVSKPVRAPDQAFSALAGRREVTITVAYEIGRDILMAYVVGHLVLYIEGREELQQIHQLSAYSRSQLTDSVPSQKPELKGSADRRTHEKVLTNGADNWRS